jgi:hypothetical protein
MQLQRRRKGKPGQRLTAIEGPDAIRYAQSHA